jgi:hypothetical protein
MRTFTIDPATFLAAMATMPPTTPPTDPARLLARARRVQYAPVTPPAISVSRAA